MIKFNDKARHPWIPGHLEERANGFEPSTFTLATLNLQHLNPLPTQ